MHNRRPWQEYLHAIVGPLLPIANHGLEAITLTIIVRLTSILLHFILPPDDAAIIETMERFYYVILMGVLCLYSFILFCRHLVSHLREEIVVGDYETDARIRSRRRAVDQEMAIDVTPATKQLPEGNSDNYIPPEKIKGKPQRATKRKKQ